MREIKKLNEELVAARLQPHYVTIVEAAGDVSKPAAGDVSQPAETTAADAAAGRAGGAAAGGGNQEVIQLEEVEVENQGKRRFACEVNKACKKSYSTQANLEKHVRERHAATNLKHSCNICGKPFYRVQQLTAHQKTHASKPLIRCEFCDAEMRSKYYLTIHIDSHHRPELGKCPTCGEECGSRVKLRGHRRHCGDHKCKSKTCGEKTKKGEPGEAEEAAEEVTEEAVFADFDPLECRRQHT